MPTYEYECPKCGVFDVFQSMKDEHLKTCPTCHSRKLKRLMGKGAGIIFKGSGFYQTDYRSSGYHSDAKADSADKTPKPADSSASTPATPAVTTPATPATPAAPATPAPAAPAKPAAPPSTPSRTAKKKR
jgi:putative FmdB family regulatory protein